MKQIVVISGKGGTGKTTIAASLAYLAENANVADCDVEAPNLSLILENEVRDTKPYIGGKKAYINKEKCISCGRCLEVCRFDAIKESFEVDEVKCEGCGACSIVCPAQAVILSNEETGQIISSDKRDGLFSYASLNIGADGAGKLVTEIRKEIVKESNINDLSIIDGSPGIGCVVIASITGCDLAIIVTEPTQSGMDDLMRVLSLTDYFNIKSSVIINKYDINSEMSNEIEELCNENGLKVIGKIPFDTTITKAMEEGKPIVSYKNSVAGQKIREIWSTLL